MPNVTIASARGFAFDPRALSQLDWAVSAASAVTGRHVSRSNMIRFALGQVVERLSWHAENGNLKAMKTYLERLPEYAKCEHATAAPALCSPTLLPWKGDAR